MKGTEELLVNSQNYCSGGGTFKTKVLLLALLVYLVCCCVYMYLSICFIL